MISPFFFAQTPSIHFGSGKFDILSKKIRGFGQNFLLITGASSFQSSPRYQKLLHDLASENMSGNVFKIPKEPSPEMIDTCVELYKDKNIQVVVAIGGGSVLDAGKAISAMLPVKEPVKYYLEGVGNRVHSGLKIPFIAVPTTSGTGSETTKNAVVSEVGENGFKKSLRHDNFVPDLSIIDPDLTISCSPFVTATSGIDAFTQLLESYLSIAGNPMTDALAWEGLKYIKSSMLRAYFDGNDISARTGMAFASMISGITLANVGLGTVHGFASPIGGFCEIPHGVVCSALMGETNRVTVRKLRRISGNEPALEKYMKVGKLFKGKDGHSDNYYVDYLLDLIEEYTLKMSIPKLSVYGLTLDDIPKIVSETDNKYNPVKLDREELEEVLIKNL